MERRGVALVGLVLVAVTAGCSHGAVPSPSPTSAPGPAEAYLDQALGVTRESAAAATMRMEETIATCMSKQGFDYVPDTSGYQVVDLADVDPPPGTRAFASQYGYGYATPPDGAITRSTAGANANEAIVSAMSPQEREAYERALFGDVAGAGAGAGAAGVGSADATDAAGDGTQTDGTQTDGAPAEDEVGGCFRAARDKVWGSRAEDHVRAGLEDEIARIDEDAAPQDPAVVAAAAEWSSCMAESGHAGLAAPPDAEKEAWDRWMAFNDAIGANPALGEIGPDGEVVGHAKIAAQEASLATADWDCRADAGYEVAWRDARDRLQQQYVDAHRAELDAWVDSFARSSGG